MSGTPLDRVPGDSDKQRVQTSIHWDLRIWKRLLATTAVVAVVTLTASEIAAFRHLQVGMPAPAVTGNDLLTNTSVSTRFSHGDRAVVITFWATWSPRSRRILTDLKKAAEAYRDQGLRIITVNVENQAISNSTRGRIRQFVEDLALPFPVIVDKGLETFYRYGVIAVPSTAILDSTGVIRFAPPSYSLTTKDRIRDTIETLLGFHPSVPDSVLRRYIPKPRASRYYNLARQMASKRLYERALWSLERSAEIDTHFAAIHSLRGRILLKLDSVDWAEREFREAVTIDSLDAAGWAGLGHIALNAGDLDIASRLMTTALASDGADLDMELEFACILARRGSTQEALDSLQAIKARYPYDFRVHENLGRIYQTNHRSDSAVSYFEAALELLYPPP